MAADLKIHVLEGATEDDLADFFSSHLGSKWFRPVVSSARLSYAEMYGPGTAHYRVEHTPNVWVGEVSWLKALVFGDEEAFVPDIVGEIQDLIGEDLPIIDGEFIEQVQAAYEKCGDQVHAYSTAGKNEVIVFLKAHVGKRVFTVSW